MGELLRSESEPNQVKTLFQTAFSIENPVMLYPVRHHSPVCSFHLQQVISQYKPQVILIEGPENATSLIPFMVSDSTKAPFCIYLSFDDKKGQISGQPDQYKAYYPFLDYSPELVALRTAAKAGIPCRFIDLSYGEILLNTAKEQATENIYQDEQGFTLGKYYQMLIEKTGCKSFGELWEMLFEIDGKEKATQDFVYSLFVYCYYSRVYADIEPDHERDVLREQQMLAQIQKAQEEYDRVLVVTGGMHTIALARFLAGQEAPQIPIKRIQPEDTPVYLMPWSYVESDRASGYEAGMVFPFYYQQVWQNISKKKKTPYEDAALKFIMTTAGEIRRKQALSITDEMQSFYMAKGLAKLRQKQECGVYELIDAVKASFIKGEIGAIQQPVLAKLYRLLTGMQMGQIAPDAGVPPIVQDFLALCRKYRIQTNTTLKKQTRLDVYNKPEHREKSRFFRQMEFLNTDFCVYQKSQEDNGATGRILLRESWEYRYSPRVQSALIDASVYGGTLRQACFNLLAKKLREEHHTARDLAQLLFAAWNMGLHEVYDTLQTQLTEVISEDMDFLSVAECFRTLHTIDRLAQHTALQHVLELNLYRIFTLIYTIAHIKREHEDSICKILQYLYQYFIEQDGKTRDEYLTLLQGIYADTEANGAIIGIAAGTLLKNNLLTLDAALTQLSAYISGTQDAQSIAVSFLKGFFMVAKDVIFVDDRLVQLLDQILKQTHGQQFLNILPDLRLAFTCFLPFEIDRIAKQINILYGVKTNDWFYHAAQDTIEMEQAQQIDHFCAQALAQWLQNVNAKED